MNTMHVHIEALGHDCKYISGGLKIVKSTNQIVIEYSNLHQKEDNPREDGHHDNYCCHEPAQGDEQHTHGPNQGDV